jgi:hypothetical protein
MSAREDYNNARRELERVARRDQGETAEFLAANRRVTEAANRLPWWKR